MVGFVMNYLGISEEFMNMVEVLVGYMKGGFV